MRAVVSITISQKKSHVYIACKLHNFDIMVSIKQFHNVLIRFIFLMHNTCIQESFVAREGGAGNTTFNF